MLLADLRYVVTSFCDLDCRMDSSMHCNNNISNIYGLNGDIMRKWLFVKKRMKWNGTFALETNFQTVVCTPQAQVYTVDCEGKESNMIITAGGRAEFLGAQTEEGWKSAMESWYSLSTLTKGICGFPLWHNTHGSAIWADNLLTSKRGGKTKCVHPNAICSITRSYSNELCWLQNKALENQWPTESIFSCWHHIFLLLLLTVILG